MTPCKTKSTFTVVAGTILSRTLTFLKKDKSPRDLSIYTEIKMEVRKGPGTDVVASARLSEGGFVVSGDDHNILDMNIQMPVVVGFYKFDILGTAPGIKDALIPRCQINILERITEDDV